MNTLEEWMHIVVCLKQVPDPEGPSDAFVISPDGKKIQPKGIPPVISIYDESALEAALRIKDTDPENFKITVLTMGSRISNAVFVKALAAGADEVLKLESEIFESGNLDSMGNASAIAAAILKIGDIDLIYVGGQSADWNAAMTGIIIGYLLNAPAITSVLRVEVNNSHLIVTRRTEEGQEKVSVGYPAVMIVNSQAGELRYPTMKQRQDAKKKPVTTWTADGIGFNYDYRNRLVLHELLPVEMRKADCTFIAGDSPYEMSKNLLTRLRSDNVL